MDEIKDAYCPTCGLGLKMRFKRDKFILWCDDCHLIKIPVTFKIEPPEKGGEKYESAKKEDIS